MPFASDLLLGDGVTISHPELVNLYGCWVGKHSKIGAFAETRKRLCWSKLQDLVSYLHLRSCHYRGRGISRSRSRFQLLQRQ